MGSDRAQQPAEEGFDLLAARPLGGTKHGSDEAALAVEDDDRLKSVFVVMGVEQPQLLAAMDRVERVVDVERDAFKVAEKIAIEIDHGAAHPQQGANVGRIPNRGCVDCEHSSQSDGVRSSAILNMDRFADDSHRTMPSIARRDHQQPKADDLRQAVGDLIGRAGIDHAGGEPIGDAKALVDLAQRQNAAIRRQQAAVKLDLDALARNR